MLAGLNAVAVIESGGAVAGHDDDRVIGQLAGNLRICRRCEQAGRNEQANAQEYRRKFFHFLITFP